MELLIKGDEIGYISREDDQSFGLFCPVVQIYDDAIAAQLVDAWNSKASPASASEGWKIVPVEPTQAMSEAAMSTFIRTSAHETEIDVDVLYHAMLAASPTLPSTEDRKDAEWGKRLLSTSIDAASYLAMKEDKS